MREALFSTTSVHTSILVPSLLATPLRRFLSLPATGRKWPVPSPRGATSPKCPNRSRCGSPIISRGGCIIFIFPRILPPMKMPAYFETYSFPTVAVPLSIAQALTSLGAESCKTHKTRLTPAARGNPGETGWCVPGPISARKSGSYIPGELKKLPRGKIQSGQGIHEVGKSSLQ